MVLSALMFTSFSKSSICRVRSGHSVSERLMSSIEKPPVEFPPPFRTSNTTWNCSAAFRETCWSFQWDVIAPRGRIFERLLHYLNITCRWLLQCHKHSQFSCRKYSDITSDLSDEAEGSIGVLFILKLSDPDVKFIWLVPTIVILELEALDMTPPFGIHHLGLQSGWVAFLTWCCANVHEVTCFLT